jgi:nucleoside-diphosphate-sugar epimerase
MKVLVTGGAGFIGGYVIEELMARGHEPVIFDHYDRGGYTCPVFLGDVRDATAVTEAMARVEGWIHLAAVLGTQETIQNPRPAAESNLMGGLNILEAAAQYDLPGVYIGVGNHWMNNTYSISKTMIERFVDMFNKNRGTRVNIVRAMNAYGPRQEPSQPFGVSRVRKITPAFVCRALAGQPVEVYGDGSQVSDMVYVSDVARALVGALDAGEVFDRVVEVGPARHITVQEFAQQVIDCCGSDSKIVNLPMRPGEIPGSTVSADVSTLELVNMSADGLVPLDMGLQCTVDYFRQLRRPVKFGDFERGYKLAKEASRAVIGV